MQRRSLTRPFARPLTRCLAAFLATWFLLVVIEPEAVHSCAVHSAVAAGHEGHGSNHQMPAGSEEPTTERCTCPDDCAATAFGNALPAISEQPADRVAKFREAALLPAQHYIPARGEFVLPFANGPPVIPA